ncbi:MAG: hypothetical protein SH857_00445 [Chitinophagales bacterium]|nr:hypothetical protein [Chitinophagales bacterium]
MKRTSLNAKLSNNREAIEDYNKAIALNPYMEYIYDQRAKLRFLISDFKGAIEDLN